MKSSVVADRSSTAADLMLTRDEAQKEVRFLSAKEVGLIISNAKEPYATWIALSWCVNQSNGECR